MSKWTVGDVSASETLTDSDHLYPKHINELRDSNPATVVVGTGADAQFSTIASAIAQLPGTGGMVYIMEGTYTVASGISVPSNVSIVGCGRTTIIKADDASSAIKVFYNSDDAGGNSNIEISNLQIDVNRANNSGNGDYGIYFKTVTDCHINNVFVQESHWKGIYLEAATNCSVNNCHVKNTRDGGIEVANSDKSAVRGCYVELVLSDSGLAPDGIRIAGDDLIVSDCIVNDSNYRGFAIEGNSGNYSNRCKIVNCSAYYFKDYGFFMNYNYECAIIGCHARGKGDSAFKASPSGGGIGYRVARYCLISNNLCETNYISGIHPGSDTTAGEITGNNVIANNVCRNNNQAGAAGLAGIFVYADASAFHNNCLITGNICYDSQGTQTQKIGIRVSTGSQEGHNIVGNHCYGNAEHGMSISGNKISITGNVCNNNGTNGTGDGINVVGAQYSTISGNMCGDTQGSPTQRNGITVAVGGTAATNITSNTCYGNTGYGVASSDNDYAIILGNNCHNNSTGGTSISGNTNGITDHNLS